MNSGARRARKRAIAEDVTVIPMLHSDMDAARFPVLKVIGHGPKTTVWVGNDGGEGFATIPAGRLVSKLAARWTARKARTRATK